MEKLAVSVKEAADILGIGINGMYELVHKEGFPVKKIGSRYLIPVKALERWLESKN